MTTYTYNNKSLSPHNGNYCPYQFYMRSLNHRINNQIINHHLAWATLISIYFISNSQRLGKQNFMENSRKILFKSYLNCVKSSWINKLYIHLRLRTRFKLRSSQGSAGVWSTLGRPPVHHSTTHTNYTNKHTLALHVHHNSNNHVIKQRLISPDVFFFILKWGWIIFLNIFQHWFS